MKNEANIHRAAIEHRAVWMGLIQDETRKQGADAEAIRRAAIKRCGNIHGARHLSESIDLGSRVGGCV